MTDRIGTKANRAAFAAGVSRTIRQTVMRPLPSGTPRSRQGVRVQSGWNRTSCSVAVDLDLPRKAARIAAEITEALKTAGYAVTPNPADPALLTVTREEAPQVTGCQWFALCDRPADGVVAHPILGDVPTCRRCADKLGLALR